MGIQFALHLEAYLLTFLETPYILDNFRRRLQRDGRRPPHPHHNQQAAQYHPCLSRGEKNASFPPVLSEMVWKTSFGLEGDVLWPNLDLRPASFPGSVRVQDLSSDLFRIGRTVT